MLILCQFKYHRENDWHRSGIMVWVESQRQELLTLDEVVTAFALRIAGRGYAKAKLVSYIPDPRPLATRLAHVSDAGRLTSMAMAGAFQ